PAGIHRRQAADAVRARGGGARAADATQGSRRVEEAGRGSHLRIVGRGRVERGRSLYPSSAKAAFRAWRQGANPHHSRRRLHHSGRKNRVISFKSIFARIIFLHVIAMVITAMFMPLVLYWFLKSAANDLHQQAMRDQADLVALHLAAGESGQLTLDLPPALRDLYSQAYGRYAYAVGDDSGRVFFSSLSDNAAIFPHA